MYALNPGQPVTTLCGVGGYIYFATKVFVQRLLRGRIALYNSLNAASSGGLLCMPLGQL